MKKIHKKQMAKEIKTHKMQIPINGALKAIGVNLEDLMTQVNYNSEFKHTKGIKSGISGKVLSHPLLKKQQEQVLAENFMRFQESHYEEDEMQTNLLLNFYPEQVQTHIVKRKHHNTEKVFRGIVAPDSKDKAKCSEALAKMRELTNFQSSMMTVIDKKSENRNSIIHSRMERVASNMK